MRAYERLLKYVVVETTSKNGLERVPSTEGQQKLALLLGEEMKVLGLSQVKVDEHGYVCGMLPPTKG